jgi:hypothetical protein
MHKFYSAFGVLTAAFSKMEAELRVLISGMAFKGEAVVASAFMDCSQLGDNLVVLKKIGRQYWDSHKTIKTIVDRIEELKKTRNLFIHGLWSPGTFGELGGSASVTDLRTTFDDKPTIRSWSHSQKSEYSLAQFQNILAEVNSVTSEIDGLMRDLEKKEKIEFGWGGITGITKPVVININDHEHL